MDTKEVIEIKKAIKFLKNIKNNMYYPPEDKDKNIDKIIALLQQGKKYKKYKLMWEDLRHNYGWIGYEGIPHINSNSIAYVSKIMDDIEQKYFPKETNEHKEGDE